ncbi:hypothetical protein RKG56_27245 [Klebsiella pneumoniae]|nr:hypothetical protein [Klebsiella pneumoniae]
MRLQQWATENIKKLLYLAGDDAVINYGKMRLEFLQKALAQDTSGDFCFRVLHPEVSGPPDMKKASAGYRDFIIGNRALLDLVNSAGEGAPVAHYSADEIQSLFSAQIQGSVDKYGDSWHCCKVSDEAAFCLIQRPYISKTLLTRRISPRGSP